MSAVHGYAGQALPDPLCLRFHICKMGRCLPSMDPEGSCYPQSS